MERRIGHVIKGSLGLQDVIANKVVQNEKEIALLQHLTLRHEK